MPEPLDHYRALLTALARLVGYHRSGCLPAELVSQFPVDLQAATVGEQVSISADKLDRRLSRLAEFARHQPGAATRQRSLTPIPGTPAQRCAPIPAARARGLELSGRPDRLHRAVPLECQRRQRLVLARRRQ